MLITITLSSLYGQFCADIYQINMASRGVSALYYIQTSTGVHQVYCDMELECGGHKGGWMRIADLDTSRGDECPDGWTNITTPNSTIYPSKVVCGSPSDPAGCYSASFTVNGASYYKMCGKARGYQSSSPDAFAALSGIKSIDGPYVDGLSITVGENRTQCGLMLWVLAMITIIPRKTVLITLLPLGLSHLALLVSTFTVSPELLVDINLVLTIPMIHCGTVKAVKTTVVVKYVFHGSNVNLVKLYKKMLRSESVMIRQPLMKIL